MFVGVTVVVAAWGMKFLGWNSFSARKTIVKAPRSGDSNVGVYIEQRSEKMSHMCNSAYAPSEVARSLLPECVEKGLNGPGECVVSEMELAICLANN